MKGANKQSKLPKWLKKKSKAMLSKSLKKSTEHIIAYRLDVMGGVTSTIDLADTIFHASSFSYIQALYQRYRISHISIHYVPVLPTMTDAAIGSGNEFDCVMAYVPGTILPSSYDAVYAQPGSSTFKTYQPIFKMCPVSYQTGSTGMLPTQQATTVSDITYCGSVVLVPGGATGQLQGSFYVRIHLLCDQKVILY